MNLSNQENRMWNHETSRTFAPLIKGLGARSFRLRLLAGQNDPTLIGALEIRSHERPAS